jgi:hypothetical protein
MHAPRGAAATLLIDANRSSIGRQRPGGIRGRQQDGSSSGNGHSEGRGKEPILPSSGSKRWRLRRVTGLLRGLLFYPEVCPLGRNALYALYVKLTQRVLGATESTLEPKATRGAQFKIPLGDSRHARGSGMAAEAPCARRT